MSLDGDRALLAELEAAARATPGVSAVFPSGRRAGRLIGAGSRLLGVRDAEAPVVARTRSPAGARAELEIGVAEPASAMDCARRVHAVLEDRLIRHGIGAAAVRVTVVQVEARDA